MASPSRAGEQKIRVTATLPLSLYLRMCDMVSGKRRMSAFIIEAVLKHMASLGQDVRYWYGDDDHE